MRGVAARAAETVRAACLQPSPPLQLDDAALFITGDPFAGVPDGRIPRAPVAPGDAWRLSDPMEAVRAAAAYAALSAALERPLTLDDLIAAHAALDANLPEEVRAYMRPGRLRVVATTMRREGEGQVYAPPPPDMAHDLLRQLLDYVEAVRQAGAITLIQCALVYYQFVAIHPFHDGNGRLSRALARLLLERHHAGAGALDLTAMVRVNRAYHDYRIVAVHRSGRWAEWVHFFCQMLIRRCAAAQEGKGAAARG
ncbi:Fic family protein [Nitrospirillum sp. BR 11163]|uniref:Fic family protein n=1 Tax=Nitrospirillum sp. BR 11163 TaxID=3104323 RepID=UPI002AFF98A6|nr:Fic family protein [Nitrospirillum sp. BR 11163]MEA1676161.1 Fic family protein [Nitrospirillum sp. BR 11163]